ncbi:MAG: hypothetical protein QNJ54_04865 [Prochloraceae cyanobacterium]|nr:hypothetical protein [Prochloraceae cyanobacterium]
MSVLLFTDPLTYIIVQTCLLTIVLLTVFLTNSSHSHEKPQPTEELRSQEHDNHSLDRATV